MTQRLIEAGADTESPGWVAQSDDVIQISPLDLVNLWISKFGGIPALILLKGIIEKGVFAKLSVKGKERIYMVQFFRPGSKTLKKYLSSLIHFSSTKYV